MLFGNSQSKHKSMKFFANNGSIGLPQKFFREGLSSVASVDNFTESLNQKTY
jgi:hypothetical protein